MNLRPVLATYETLGAEDIAECKVLQDLEFSPQSYKTNKKLLYGSIVNTQLPTPT